MTTGSIRIAMTSDVGLRRKNNQDTGFAQQGVFMVCDGMVESIYHADTTKSLYNF